MDFLKTFSLGQVQNHLSAKFQDGAGGILTNSGDVYLFKHGIVLDGSLCLSGMW